MDFQSFLNTVKFLPSKDSILIRGRHGIGKSEVVYQLANHFDLPVKERRISQITEGDLIGLPFQVARDSTEMGAATKFLPLDWFIDCMEEPHLIFLDEIDRGSYEVQQAVFELILDRSIQGNKIHKDCRIFAAINGGKHGANYHVNEMDPAMIDRFFIVDLEPSVEDWVKWAQESGVNEKVVSFIQVEGNDHLEHKLDYEVGKIYPSRRSWVKFANVLNQFPELLESISKNPESRASIINLGSGYIGAEATSKFLDYVTSDRVFVATDILDNWETAKSYFSKKENAKNIPLINSINEKIYTYFREANANNQKITAEQINNYFEFWLVFPSETKHASYSKFSTDTTIEMEAKTKLANKMAPLLVSLLNDKQ